MVMLLFQLKMNLFENYCKKKQSFSNEVNLKQTFNSHVQKKLKAYHLNLHFQI